MICASLIIAAPLLHSEQIDIPTGTVEGMIIVGTFSSLTSTNERLSILVSGTAGFEIHNYTSNRQTLQWGVKDIPISANWWTTPSDDSTPESEPYAGTFTNTVHFAATRAKDGQKVSIQIKNPKISFNGL